MAISVEDGRLILPPAGALWERLQARVPDPSQSLALLAVILIHAAALGGLLAYRVAPRVSAPEAVIQAAIIPETADADEASLPARRDWQPVLPEVPLPRLALEQPSTAITLPPVARPVPVAPARSAATEAPPVIDAQAVGYLVPPVPRYPPASRRAREEGEVLIRVLIDVEGRPSVVEVLRSSGYVRLDEAAVDAVRAALFRPYVADGRARAAYVRVPVEFALRRG